MHVRWDIERWKLACAVGLLVQPKFWGFFLTVYAVVLVVSDLQREIGHAYGRHAAY